MIARIICNHMGWGVDADMPAYFECIHNYIDHDSNIVRKGAISAKFGEKVLIPMNMRDGCILGTGKGNEDWNCSAPHGAGRLMSRTKARETLNLSDYAHSMDGIYTMRATVGDFLLLWSTTPMTEICNLQSCFATSWLQSDILSDKIRANSASFVNGLALFLYRSTFLLYL